MEFIETFSAFYREWDWLLYSAIYIGAIFTIIFENRDPNKSLAYLLLLIFLPILGLIIFYFFGRDYRKRRRFRLKEEKDQQVIDKYWRERADEFRGRLEELGSAYGGLVEPARMLFNRHEGITFSGNRVDLLLNGEEKFPRLFEGLKNARHHIHLEYYILTEDDVGNAITEILVERARDGVEVRVIDDGLGTTGIGKIPRRLKQAGVCYQTFMPVRFAFLASANYRNHRKIVVIDGKIGYVGGINLDDRYWNNGKHDLYWRDTHLRLEGSTVNNLQLQFLTSWHFVSEDHRFPIQDPYFGVAEEKLLLAKQSYSCAEEEPHAESPSALRKTRSVFSLGSTNFYSSVLERSAICRKQSNLVAPTLRGRMLKDKVIYAASPRS